MRLRIRAWVKAERRYSLFSCPGSAAAAAVAAAVDQQGDTIAWEQLLQPAEEGAAIAARSRRSS